ncbi:hypothetical protein EVG20_g9278 [Dentipellis fragilis]|uniref:MARVEL domain-containing protein n=1 Tax=Dentipellis fragilis TaxID=205917 RepID=A0A4Y9Y1W4_9AGAM|nr:hypothetical protein EVG20_g9278 [Dentipellis fragilis]
MRSPVVIFRFVSLALITYLNLFALVFAGWNIAATKAAGLGVQGGSAFLIINACFLFLFLAASLAELAFPQAKTAGVAFECLWTGVMAILELAASIDITVSGPPFMCKSGAPFSVCASSTVLVPISWLAGILMLAYFLALLSMSLAHMEQYPAIWYGSIYTAPWFVDRDDKAPQLPPLQRGSGLAGLPAQLSPPAPNADIEQNARAASPNRSVAASSALESESARPDLQMQASEQDKGRPWWALQARLRPGKDLPFSLPSRKGKEPQRQPSFGNYVSPRASTYQGSVVYPELEKRLPGLPPLPPYPQFTREMLDPDKPIPLPRMSAWVRADGGAGDYDADCS